MAAQGWWRASDGYWYPSDARPGEMWTGQVRGPHGERPPGPGWWLASDYQWYPPDARPGELWDDPIARRDPMDTVRAPRVPGAVRPQRSARPSRPQGSAQIGRAHV